MNHFKWLDNPNRVNPPDDDYVFEQEMQPSIDEIVNTLKDPIILWEAMSVDGFTGPFTGPVVGIFEHKQNATAQENLESALVQAVAEKDFNALGELVFDQLTTYAERIIRHRS